MWERILFGLTTALIGIGGVFILLGVLIGFIKLFELIANNINSVEKKPILKVSEIKPVFEEGISEEIAAAIIAAVNCCYETEYHQDININNENKSSKIDFIVRSIKCSVR